MKQRGVLVHIIQHVTQIPLGDFTKIFFIDLTIFIKGLGYIGYSFFCIFCMKRLDI